MGARILFDETFPGVFTAIDGPFKNLARELSRAGYEASPLRSPPITREKLQQADVFVISDRWKDFTTAEISDLKEFVRSGGGLLLIGVGWSWVDYQKLPIQRFPINVLGQEFSMTVNDDIIADETNDQGDSSNPIFHTFASHPVTYGLSQVAPAKGMLPSSLTVWGSSQAAVTGDGDAYSTYHQRVYSKGMYPPVVAVNTYGSGRVVLFGHDGFFTALEKYDNLKLALNVFNWLSGPQQTTLTTAQTTRTAQTSVPSISVVTETLERTLTPTQTAESGPGYASYFLIAITAVLVILSVTAARVVMGRKRLGEAQEVEGRMQVEVLHRESGKVVRLEVQPNHTVGSVVETIVTGLKLPKAEYVVLAGEKELGTAEYSRTLQSVGVGDGAQLQLMRKR